MTEEDLIGRQRRGTEIPVELGVTPLPPDADARILVTIRDASAQARIAGLLRRTRESEALFRGLLEAAPDAVLVVSADGRIELANDQVVRMFGHPREQLIGAPLEVLIPETSRARHGELMRGYFTSPRRRPTQPRAQRARRQGHRGDPRRQRRAASSDPQEFTPAFGARQRHHADRFPGPAGLAPQQAA